MTQRTDRVREILDLALERPSAERAAFVAGAAGPDQGLREEVESLLRALEAGGDALEPPGAAGDASARGEAGESLTGLAFGPYVVGARLGEGGMGVVYATRDTRLGRTVAVKALPSGLAKDPHRRARLEQEARLLAALSHPNIAAIYGVEDTPRGPVMILEYVPGRTLAAELAEATPSVDEALQIARQIAGGLEAAHAAGIIHRDLKPANIVLTPDRTVKILDLGVAKGPRAEVRERGSDSVVRAAATRDGEVVGTVAYMSPEQARGRAVDRRADLWSFGCVLYELLTGRPAFDGETASDVAAAVLRAEPDWSRLPARTPAGVRRVLHRCLEKDPERRLRDAGDAALELEAEPEPAAPGTRGGWWRWVAAAAGVAGVGGGVYVAVQRAPSRERPPVVFSITTPPLNTQTIGAPIALSPDGGLLAYCSFERPDGTGLWLRRLDSPVPALLARADNASSPTFTPDGRWLGYYELLPSKRSVVRRVEVSSGVVETYLEWPGAVLDTAWGDDGTLVVVHGAGSISEVAGKGAAPRALLVTDPDPQRLYSQPELLPGSGVLLFTSWRKEASGWAPTIEAMDRATRRTHVVLERAAQAHYARDERLLLYMQAGWVHAAPFNPGTARITGPASRLAGPTDFNDQGAFERYAAGNSAGVIALVPGQSPEAWTDIQWFDADGSNATVHRGTIGIRTLRLSPDASRLAFSTEPPEMDLWVLDLARGTLLRLTQGGGASFPVWTPDGARVAFLREAQDRSCRIEWIASDGSGTASPIYTFRGGGAAFPTGFSPDGQQMLVSAVTGPDDATDLFLARPGEPGDGRRLLETPSDRVAARFSPDGSLLAYASTETGRSEVYVHPYPALDRKVRVSLEGGERPTWSADGTLFYRYADTVYRVSLRTSPVLECGVPTAVVRDLPGARYDTFPAGNRFITCRPRGEWGPRTRIDVLIGAVGAPSPTK